MLERIGILTSEERSIITAALQEIEKEIEKGELAFRDDLEDIHMHVEHRLIEKVGDARQEAPYRPEQKRTGFSRRPNVCQGRAHCVDERLKALLIAIIEKARAEKTVNHARLHAHEEGAGRPLCPLSPILLPDVEEGPGEDRPGKNPGRRHAPRQRRSCRFHPSYRQGLSVRAPWLFANIENSMDATSDRDFVLDALYGTAMIMMHLSKLSEDLILFSTEEFAFIALPDGLCTGSSLMPHKKNPDALELVRGKTSRSIGNLFTLFTLSRVCRPRTIVTCRRTRSRLFQSMVGHAGMPLK